MAIQAKELRHEWQSDNQELSQVKMKEYTKYNEGAGANTIKLCTIE